MKNPVAESFRITINFMKFFRWYPDNDSKLNKIQGYVMYLTLVVLLVILIVANICIEKEYTSMQLIYVTVTLTYCFKLLPFLTNGQRIKNCIHYFDKPYFTPKNDAESDISNNSVKLCQRISLAYIIGLACCEIMYTCPSAIPYYGFPLKIWLPYDPTSGLINYYATFVYLGAGCVYDGSAASLIDPLIGGLAYHAAGHLKILKHMIQNVRKISPNETRKNEVNSSAVIYHNLVKCIEYHNEVLKFVDEFEKCFTWVIFSQMCGTTISTCFCCIAVFSAPLASLDAAIYIFLIPVVLWQVFFYCYYGTLLFDENESLTTAVYLSDWYEYDIKAKRLLITIMERSKRPIIIRAGNFIDLTLVTFSKIIKSSYSLIACFK